MKSARIIANSMILLIILALTPCVSAIELQSTAGADSTELRDERWALNFGISSNFTLEPFQDLAISATQHSSKRSALRFGLDFSFASRDYDEDGRKSEQTATEFIAQYLFYPNPDASPALYLGIGPSFGYSRTTSEYSVPESYTQENDLWTVGAAGAIGVEWLVARNLGITAEYGFSAEYGRDTSSRSSGSYDEGEVTTFEVAFSRVLFGLSVYI